MTTYTFDIFSTLDGFASYDEPGDWGGYWGKQGPEFLDRRLAQYQSEQRIVFGGNPFRQHLEFQAMGVDFDADPVNKRLRHSPTTVISSTLEGPQDWPDATVVSG